MFWDACTAEDKTTQPLCIRPNKKLEEQNPENLITPSQVLIRHTSRISYGPPDDDCFTQEKFSSGDCYVQWDEFRKNCSEDYNYDLCSKTFDRFSKAIDDMYKDKDTNLDILRKD